MFDACFIPFASPQCRQDPDKASRRLYPWIWRTGVRVSQRWWFWMRWPYSSDSWFWPTRHHDSHNSNTESCKIWGSNPSKSRPILNHLQLLKCVALIRIDTSSPQLSSVLSVAVPQRFRGDPKWNEVPQRKKGGAFEWWMKGQRLLSCIVVRLGPFLRHLWILMRLQISTRCAWPILTLQQLEFNFLDFLAEGHLANLSGQESQSQQGHSMN